MKRDFGNGHFTLAVRTRPRNESHLASHIRERSTRARCGLWTMSSGGNGGRPPLAKSNDGGPSNDGGSGQSTPQSSNPPSAGHSRQPSFAPAEDAGVYRRSTSSVDFTDIGSAVAAMPPPPPRPPSRGPSNDSAPQSRPISRTGTETEQLSAMVHVPKGSLEVGNVIVGHDKLATSGVLGVIPGAGAAPTAKPRPLGPKAWLKMDEEVKVYFHSRMGNCTDVVFLYHRVRASRCQSRNTGSRPCFASRCAIYECWSPTSATRTPPPSYAASGASCFTSSRSAYSSPRRRYVSFSFRVTNLLATGMAITKTKTEATSPGTTSRHPGSWVDDVGN